MFVKGWPEVLPHRKRFSGKLQKNADPSSPFVRESSINMLLRKDGMLDGALD